MVFSFSSMTVFAIKVVYYEINKILFLKFSEITLILSIFLIVYSDFPFLSEVSPIRLLHLHATESASESHQGSLPC